jgi:threonyl-tRNA synthetase
MSSIVITLPDGSQKSLPARSRPLDVALAISPRLADDAIAAKVNGEMFDLTRPLDSDVHLQILTTRDPEALEVYRHSTAHLLAAAVLEALAGYATRYRPSIENGFCYGFDKTVPSPPTTSKKSRPKCGRSRPATSSSRPRHDRKRRASKYAHLWMKSELIAERAGETFSEYTLGPEFLDFCRGPHLPSTKKIKAFKLLHLAGPYWKGDEHDKQLQRIYGTAFFSKKELDEFIARQEEAKRRDHRKLGAELDLFSIQELAGPGLIFFHPKGGIIRKHPRRLDARSLSRARLLPRLYPHVARRDLWKVSGHADFYSENMFKPMELDDAEYQLKPMNCPCTS